MWPEKWRVGALITHSSRRAACHARRTQILLTQTTRNRRSNLLLLLAPRALPTAHAKSKKTNEKKKTPPERQDKTRQDNKPKTRSNIFIVKALREECSQFPYSSERSADRRRARLQLHSLPPPPPQKCCHAPARSGSKLPRLMTPLDHRARQTEGTEAAEVSSTRRVRPA